jgi:hypothetical protein
VSPHVARYLILKPWVESERKGRRRRIRRRFEILLAEVWWPVWCRLGGRE